MKRIVSLLSVALFSGAAVAGNTPEGAQTGKPAFEEVDADQDQRISSMEARPHRGIAAAFAQADVDKDGYLTREEFDSIS